MHINKENKPTEIFDRTYSRRCPHCHHTSNITAISIPRYEFLERFHPDKLGLVFRCDRCNEPLFAAFPITSYDLSNHRIVYDDSSPSFVEFALEPFEYDYLPESVATDFREATTCYAVGAFSAFAAMCRRTIQSMAANLGAKGKDKVADQLKSLRALEAIDDSEFEACYQIIVGGHDGAHPYLPAVSADRAGVLMDLMKDVLNEVYVRKARIQESARMRRQQISGSDESA